MLTQAMAAAPGSPLSVLAKEVGPPFESTNVLVDIAVSQVTLARPEPLIAD